MQTPTTPDVARQVAAIQRRLERWELDHLRTHAAQQAERIESLERELYRTQDEAEYWHRECQSMVEQLQADGREVGLTQAGELVVMPTPDALPPWTDAVLGTACSPGSFHTVGELLLALGMNPAQTSPSTEAALRRKLEEMGAEKVKCAPLAGGPRAWGYYFRQVASGEPSVATEKGGAA